MIRSAGPAGPFKVVGVVAWQLRYDLLAIVVVAAAMVWLSDVVNFSSAAGVVPLLGVVVSIFIGFRNSSAYNRWWEARTQWGAVVANCRAFNNALTWDADQSHYYTDVQVDGIQRATVAGFPRSAVDIPGLLPSADEAHFVTWLANTADIWGGPRLSGITVNLYPMDSTKTAAYLGLDLKSRAFPLNTPPQLPTPMVVTVEGYTETVTDSAWMLSFNTAPDPRFVLGDTVSGVLASNYRVCPMG